MSDKPADLFAKLQTDCSSNEEIVSVLCNAASLIKKVVTSLDNMKSNPLWAVQAAMFWEEFITKQVIVKYNALLNGAKSLNADNSIIMDADYLPSLEREAINPDDLEYFVEYVKNALKRIDKLKSILEGDENIKSIDKDEEQEGCFIATAVYGSYNEPEVITLREFRDSVLLKSRLGRCCVHWYYKFSPRAVYLLREKKIAMQILRVILNIFVNMLNNKRCT